MPKGKFSCPPSLKRGEWVRILVYSPKSKNLLTTLLVFSTYQNLLTCKINARSSDISQPFRRSNLWHRETSQKMPQKFISFERTKLPSQKKHIYAHTSTYFAQKNSKQRHTPPSPMLITSNSQNVLNRHSHLTKMTLLHPTQG